MKSVSEIQTLPGAKMINTELLEYPHLLIKTYGLKSFHNTHILGNTWA